MSSQPIWFDSHAHLQDDDFTVDLAQVLQHAFAAGIERILLPSSDYADAMRAIELASSDDHLVCAVGCHPHEAASFRNRPVEQWHDLIRSHRERPVVAVGEIGLDYHYDHSPRPVQQAVFRLQLELAYVVGLPVIIHEREATADCLAVLKSAAAAGHLRPQPGVFHCYSGSLETAAILLEMGFSLGFDGPITFKNARRALEVIERCPPERLLLETDSPYLAPVPLRGRRNEPANLPLIGAVVAQIWQVPIHEVAGLTTANACRLFDLPE